jgi:hypothetical protein
MEKSATVKAVIDEINAGCEVLTAVSEVQYLNNILEQNHLRSSTLPN